MQSSFASIEDLMPFLRREVETARNFHSAMTEMGEVLSSGGEPEHVLRLNEAILSGAALMQQLFTEREEALAGLGLSLEEATEQSAALAEALDTYRGLVLSARTLNEENSVVVKALLDQSSETLMALQRAARQDSVYTAKGKSKGLGSRTLAAV